MATQHLQKNSRPSKLPPPPASRASPTTTLCCAPPASPPCSPADTPPTPCPQMARANVNCRIFPGEDPEDSPQNSRACRRRSKSKREHGPPDAAPTANPSPPSPSRPARSLPEVSTPWKKLSAKPTPAPRSSPPCPPEPPTANSPAPPASPPSASPACSSNSATTAPTAKMNASTTRDFYDGITFNYLLLRSLSSTSN